MNNFEETLIKAKDRDAKSFNILLEKFKPLLIKTALVDSSFDEDLYQELQIIFIQTLYKFKIFDN